jgi:nicotinate dehydrogenase subunit B
VANSTKQTGTTRTGRGFAFGTFGNTQVAMVADITVNMKTGKIQATHLWLGHQNGMTMGPDLVGNQAEGAAVMGLSRAFEGLTFTKERVTSVDWVTYPILRFKDSPKVTVAIAAPDGTPMLNVPGVGVNTQAANTAAANLAWTPTGSGEPGSVPPAAAVANAFFDATGVRIREVPMTPPVVRATLKAAGVA